MTVANRAIKQRGKAPLDRIQEDIRTQYVIRNGAVEDNKMVHLAESDELTIDSLPGGPLSVPLEFWLEHKDACRQHQGSVAVQLASDQDTELLEADLADLDMVVLPFVNFVDGRGYSHAHLLRERHGFKGEIRATGDVHYDQLDFLARTGVDAFELPDSDDSHAALKAFNEFSEVYQPATDQGRLIFSRRRSS